MLAPLPSRGRPPAPAGSRTTSSGAALGDQLAEVHGEDVVAGVDHHLHVVLDQQLAETLRPAGPGAARRSRRAPAGSCRRSARRAAAAAGPWPWPGRSRPGAACRRTAPTGSRTRTRPGGSARSRRSRPGRRLEPNMVRTQTRRPGPLGPVRASAPSWMLSWTSRSGSSRTVWNVRATRFVRHLRRRDACGTPRRRRAARRRVSWVSRVMAPMQRALARPVGPDDPVDQAGLAASSRSRRRP